MERPATRDVRDHLLREVFWRAPSPVKSTAARFGISRQAAQRHARQLVAQGVLQASGTARWMRYRLARAAIAASAFQIAQALTEDRVWSEFFRDRVESLGADERDILAYGITEMANNVIDHAAASTLKVNFWRSPISLTVRIEDDGVGIFQKIASALQLSDPRQSLLELGKGKFTTDPARHTGEGVFFTSRAFDRFSLRSGNLLFSRTARSDDWLVESENIAFSGTRVTMSLLLPAERRLEEVFAQYSSGPEDYRFAKTHVPLKLARFGDETLLSRSSARRVLARVDRFSEVLLDFKAVDSIGPAFADEIFRVFATQHPEVELITVNANAQVTAMIRRAQAGSK
jgi:anti-sigma regulatory factor (Ser/Thr protein kinase)